MEATKGEQASGLLNQILPPRLEDAGLEDCALPPDSIKEAFLKAASAVKSRATSIFTDDTDDGGDCVQDPWPEAKDITDAIVGAPPVAGAADDVLVGIETGLDEQGSCVAEKGGGLVEDGRDEVVVGGGDMEEKEKGKGCVDGGGFDKGTKDDDGDEEEEDGEGKRPILTEGVV